MMDYSEPEDAEKRAIDVYRSGFDAIERIIEISPSYIRRKDIKSIILAVRLEALKASFPGVYEAIWEAKTQK